METRAVNHPTGRGFVCVVQQVRLVVFFFTVIVLILHQRFIICLCLQSLPSLPHLESGDIWGRSWNGGRRGLVLHNTGGADTDLSQDSSLVMHTHSLRLQDGLISEHMTRKLLYLFMKIRYVMFVFEEKSCDQGLCILHRLQDSFF